MSLVWFVFPTSWRKCCGILRCRGMIFSRLNTILIGAQAGQVPAPALAQLLDRAKAAFKVKNVAVAYTHPWLAGCFAVSTDGEAADLLPGVKAKVSTGTDSKGELLLHSASSTNGLWNAKTGAPDLPLERNGWLSTGVEGILRSDGKLLL